MPEIPGQPEKKIYPTLTGLPLSFQLDWPFHKSTSGADFWVLHGDVRLENSAGLHAPVAVNLSVTVREILPSLEAKDFEAPVINALRKQVDRRQVEFVKSGKLVPVHFSSRFYDFRNKKWVFGKASDDDISRLLLRKVYWQTLVAEVPVWIGDPTEALYLEAAPEHVLKIARKLKEQAFITLQAESASANAALMAQKEKFDTEMQTALSEIEKKYAFERG
jgi:DNA-dependent RNA polymerase auxiliary subunit epsilon